MDHKNIIIYVGLFLALNINSLPAAHASEDSIDDLYVKTCSVCHGEKGDGNSHARRGLNPPPKNFTTPGLGQTLTRDYMIHVTTHGKPDTAMVGFSSQLSDKTIAQLVDFIRNNFMQLGKTQTTSSAYENGKKIFASSCSVCHGDNGAGAVWGATSLNPAPANFTRLVRDKDLTRERMIASVTYGKSGTAMSAFQSQLNPQQINDVVDYIYHTFMLDSAQAASTKSEQSKTASTVGMAVLHGKAKESDSSQQATADETFHEPLPAGLKGDLDIGRSQYMQNCATCHGAKGNGDGPRAYFIFPRPRNFNHPASQARFSRKVLFDAIKKGVPGREMPAWDKVMNEQQIANVTEYVFQSFVNKK